MTDPRTPDSGSALRLRRVVKRYGEITAVNGLDLDVPEGTCVGLLGPNGAGKSTTMRMLTAQTIADEGSIEVLGFRLPEDSKQARAQCGVVPQIDNLDPDFTVRENLQVYGRYFGLSKAAIDQRIPELLEFAGLANRAGDNIKALSGGMKRRLTLARALINDPDLIFLDEPTTGLDPQARHLIWQRLRQLAAQGKTIFLTTHFMDEAERLCDRLAIMDHGRIMAMDTPRQLVAAHIEPQVVEVFGDGAEAWASAHGGALCERCEQTGETVFCYARDVDRLLGNLEQRPDLRYLHRPANLEDVFLRLTGRDLRD